MVTTLLETAEQRLAERCLDERRPAAGLASARREPHRGGHGPVRHVARGGDPQADPARRYLIIDSCVCLMAVRAHRYGLHARRTRRRDLPEPAHAAELRRQLSPAADIMRLL